MYQEHFIFKTFPTPAVPIYFFLWHCIRAYSFPIIWVPLRFFLNSEMLHISISFSVISKIISCFLLLQNLTFHVPNLFLPLDLSSLPGRHRFIHPISEAMRGRVRLLIWSNNPPPSSSRLGNGYDLSLESEKWKRNTSTAHCSAGKLPSYLCQWIADSPKIST